MFFNYFTGWGSKNKETTNTSPETPSWEKTRQGVPSVEETFAAEKQDEHHDEEQLVHHRAEEYGMERDPAHQMMNDYVPGWIHEATHSTGGLHGDRIALVAIVALTLLLIHLINSCMDRSAREAPLIRRLADMDKKLFASSNELLLLRKEVADGPPPPSELTANHAVLRSLEVQVEQARADMEEERRRVAEAESRVACLQEEVNRSKQEVSSAVEETQQAQGMVEELLQEKARLQEGGGADKQLLDVVQQLQSQLEGQRGLLLKYEPKLKKKAKEVKQMKADVANANLEADKLRKQLEEVSRAGEQNETTVEELKRQQEEWKSLSDLLQSQLDAKNEEVAGFEEKLVSIGEELSSTKSRMLLFKNEAESKEEQVEILQETLEELQQRKKNGKEAESKENGWDDESADGWEVEEVAEAKEIATLKIESKKAVEARDALQEEVSSVRARLEEVESEALAAKEETATLREVRDEVVKDRGDVQRRLDVLTEFFNKKDAESTARKLISVTSELESTGAQVKLLRTELEDQEKSLKASVAAQEKKAHENWVAARQAERRLTEVQSEMSVFRNRLTVAESKNTLLEQEKADLSEAVVQLQQQQKAEPQGHGETRSASNPPSESGLQASSPGPSSLPPLP